MDTKRFLPLAAFALLAAFLAGCGATPAPAASSVTATARPQPSESAGGLSEAALRNGAYELPDIGAFQLQDGTFEDKYGEGATQVNQVFFQAAAFGDLNGDSTGDAAVVIVVTMGGSGSFYYLVPVLNEGGAPRQAGSALLGDRVQIDDLQIQGGQMALRMLVAGPDDPQCCPSQQVSRVYELKQGKPELISEEALTPEPTGAA